MVVGENFVFDVFNALIALGTTDTFLRDTERLTVHISQFKVNTKNSRFIEKMMSQYYESY